MGKAEVLSLLRDGEYVSGEEISRALGVTRAAVWKAVQAQPDYERILEASKSKRYPRTRLQRLLLCAYLGIDAQALLREAPYVRVLAFDELGRAVLRQAKKTGGLPLVNAGQTPPDTVVLTLACGKYRFNDLDLGTVGGLPRLLDMGQCNDAYGAVKVAGALAEAFGCGVNDLPLSMVLSWYEQKAVCILLSLLYLGIRNMRLGPSLPAFLSPGVLKLLGERYRLTPITTPEADLKAMLA